MTDPNHEKPDTQQHKTFRFYLPLAPLREHYSDDGSTVLVQAPVRIGDGRTFEAALIGPRTDPLMARVSMFGLYQNPPPEDILQIDQVAETIISILRIYYDNDISLVEGGLRYANLIEEASPPAFNITVQTNRPGLAISSDTFSAFLNAPDDFKNIIKLFSESRYNYLPIQYRYLSLFKIIEFAFKNRRRKWSPKLDVLFQSFEAEYEAMNISQKSMKAIFLDLRDKCAHIKLGDADYLGIVGISSKDTTSVQKFMPLLTKIVQKYVFEKYKVVGREVRPTDVW